MLRFGYTSLKDDYDLPILNVLHLLNPFLNYIWIYLYNLWAVIPRSNHDESLQLALVYNHLPYATFDHSIWKASSIWLALYTLRWYMSIFYTYDTCWRWKILWIPRTRHHYFIYTYSYTSNYIYHITLLCIIPPAITLQIALNPFQIVHILFPRHRNSICVSFVLLYSWKCSCHH